MSDDLLFELGTEEIPPHFLPELAGNLKDEIVTRLQDERLGFGEIDLYYTPRRLAVRVRELDESQGDRAEKHRGPPKNVGLDDEGNYTIAAEKFAQGHGLTRDDLYVEETKEGTYFFVDKRIEGKRAGELLPDLVKAAVNDLDQPEKMSWDDSSIRFIRPIRWITCLLGSEKLDLVLGNVNSSDATRGHRFHGEEKITLTDPSEYESALEDNYVIPDPEKRKEEMEVQFSAITDELGASRASNQDFLELLSNTLEYPSAVQGSFPEDFLELPDELLFKTLTGEARLIPLIDAHNEPISTFVGFRDGPAEETDRVRRGYESVINARLRDSKFFFSHDREKPLESYLEELKKVTFQENLGSVHDKVQRMRKIAERLSYELEGFDREIVDRTVKLAKADLVTEVVDEFPSLEGTIGAYYAELDGEPDDVVQGIKNHYSPRSSEDDPPKNFAAIATSIADNMDTLFGSFLIGERPSGTKDPYGLRRKTDGIIRTMVDREINTETDALVEYTGSLFDMDGVERAVASLESYFQERLERVLERVYSVPYDVVNAISVGSRLNFYDSYLRASTLEKFKERQEMKDLVDSFKRIVNITQEREKGEVEEELFRLNEEKALWSTVSGKKDEMDKLAREQSYRDLARELIGLKDPIDDYFDNVMVMAEDEEIRNNRLNFLLYLKEPFLKLGDLSKIVTE